MSTERAILRNDRQETMDAIASRRQAQFERELVDQTATTEVPTQRAGSQSVPSQVRTPHARNDDVRTEREAMEEARRWARADDHDAARRGLASKLAGAIEQVYDGDGASAGLAIADAILQAVPSAVAPVVRREMQTEEALDRFAAAYPEIVADPVLAGLADRHLEQARAEGRGEDDAFQAAGERTREHIKKWGAAVGLGDQEHPANEARADDASTSQVIAEMAASRPGAVARREREDAR